LRPTPQVRIPLEKEGRFCVCVSSQAGCAQGCTFCATGRLGLLRSLSAWEIVEQVRTVRLDLAAGGLTGQPPGRVHGVVFQGMGEPMANLDAVLDAISVLSDPAACQISAANITVSTVGSNPNGIRRLAREAPKVRLALSIGAARAEVRSQIMPVERIHALRGDIFDAAVEHALVTKMQPLWALTPLAGVNDSDEDAAAFAQLALDFTQRTGGIRPRISIVPYNNIAEESDPYERVPLERESAFRNVMRDAGVFTHKRYSGGGDVGAACGQLAGAAGAEQAAAEGGGGAAVAMPPSENWAGQWAGGVREAQRPVLGAAY
jgi:23S rRNA (adenine2503-C2)-methyltransferase